MGGGSIGGGPTGSSLNGSMQSTITTTRRDAAAFLRRIHELEHDLKTSKEASRQMVLSHFTQCKDLKRERDELRSEVNLLKMQSERLKEGYQQSVTSAATLEELLESARKNSSEMSMLVDRSREESRHMRTLLDSEKRTTTELRDKLSCYGNSSSTRFMYSVADYSKWQEELKACKEEVAKVQSKAEFDMLGMAQSARKWGTERLELRKSIDAKDSEITMLKDLVATQKLRLKQQGRQQQEAADQQQSSIRSAELLNKDLATERKQFEESRSKSNVAIGCQIVLLESVGREGIQGLENEMYQYLKSKADAEAAQRRYLAAAMAMLRL